LTNSVTGAVILKNQHQIDINNGAFMKNKILLTIIIIMELLVNQRTIAQIPAKGADFPTMTGLRWGMTMKEARDSIVAKREIQKTTSTTLSYEDTILSTKAIITLKFTEKDKEMILDFIDVPLNDPTRELVNSVEKYLVSHYGDQYEIKKETKSKFFITIEMELKKWRLQNEEVGLVVCYKGDDVIGTNLTYQISKPK
jgi:hypothetical protein